MRNRKTKEWVIVKPGKDVDWVKAETQKEAIKKSGVNPPRSTHARPRTGDAKLMTRKEFKQFMRD